MVQRIGVLVALDGSDDGLKNAITSAERSLGELAASAKTAGDKASAGMAELKAGMGALGDQISRAKGQLLAFLTIDWAAGKVREIAEVGDAWNGMAARLKLATAGQREFAVAQQEVLAIAQRIGTPIKETAALYGRLQNTVRELGGEQKEAFELTESLSQALRISGTSGEEASASVLHFSTALTKGVLSGREFNQMAEHNPRLMRALADGLNVPISGLRKMAEEGRLTADVMVNALLGQKEKLAAEYEHLPEMAGEAFTRLENAFGRWVSQVNASSGASDKLAVAMSKLAANLDTVMAVLSKLAEIGLGVLIYRMLPALVTAWQTVTVAGVTAANSITAAWATVNLSLDAAVASVGRLRAGFLVFSAFVAGWEIGTWLQEKFAIVRQAGVMMVHGLMETIELLRYSWEVFAALFTSDTISAATQRHQARLTEMRGIFAEMQTDAARGTAAAQEAMMAAGDSAEAINRRLEAVRQGTQGAVERGIEEVAGAVGKLKSALSEVETEAGKAETALSGATTRLAAAYQGLTSIVEAALQRQVDAIKARYGQEEAALANSTTAEAARIALSTKLLVDAITQQAGLRQQATLATLQLIDEETQARITAAARQGKTEDERTANVRRVEAEILTAKQKALAQILTEYRQNIDALNAEANRNLGEVKRIEEEKRLLHASTEDRIRALTQSAMGAYEAYQDKMSQITDLQVKARAAINAGEYDRAKEYAKQAQDLAAQTAGAVVDGDRTIVTQKEAVARSISNIQAAESLAIEALSKEGEAHKRAADAAQTARVAVEKTLTETQGQITGIEASLKDTHTLSIDANVKAVITAVTDLDKLITERTRLMVIQASLEQAQKELQKFDQLLKDGKELPIGANVTKAKEALDQLKLYADEKSNVELRVATDKALGAVAAVTGQITALNKITTESKHAITTNAAAATKEVMALDGVTTHSEHIITVHKVEANATGGPVGVAGFAAGGAVGGFPRLAGGSVPGSGNGDTVPRTLDAGAFVVRKAAVQKYGTGILSRLANGVAGFARGGPVRRFASGGPAKPPADVRKWLEDKWGYDPFAQYAGKYLPDDSSGKDGGGKGARTADPNAGRAYSGRTDTDGYAHAIDPEKGYRSGDSFQNNNPPLPFDVRQVPEKLITAANVLEYAREMLNSVGISNPLLGSLGPSIQAAIGVVESNPANMAQVKSLLQMAETIGANPYLFSMWGKTYGSAGKTPDPVWFIDWLGQHRAGDLGGAAGGAVASSSPSTDFAKRFFGSNPLLRSGANPLIKRRMADGGATGGSDTVPAMLTPGEYVVNRQAVSRYGYGLFAALNAMALPARAMAERVRGYATGGLVGAAARGGDLGAALLDQLRQPMRRSPGLDIAGNQAPNRTVRVEFASGAHKVAASIDGSDEARLLDLLSHARMSAA